MTESAEKKLYDLVVGGKELMLVEPHIYEIRGVATGNEYDAGFGSVYDVVACNPLYNRLVWGYPIEKLASLADRALRSSSEGPILDLGCGSLAFTAAVYCRYSERPVVLVDQSIKMLRIAKARLVKQNGSVPANMVFLRADACLLPFRKGAFNTVISENLLHCIADTKKLIADLKQVLSADGRMYFTTLIRGNRLGDRYLEALARRGSLISRSMDQHRAVFEELGMAMQYEIQGNMAFISPLDE